MTWFITFQLLGFQINPLSHTPLSINSLHSQFTFAFAFIQTFFVITNTCIKSTFAFTSFMPIYVSCFISSWHKIEHFKVFYNIRNTQFCMWIIDIVATTAAFTCFNTKWKNTGSSPLTLTSCGLTLHSWLFTEIQLSGAALYEFTPVKVNKNAYLVKKHFLINPSILFEWFWMSEILSTAIAS